MIIRVRTPQKQHRLDVDASNDIVVLRKKISELLSVPPDAFQLARDPNGSQPVVQSVGVTLAALGLRNGDLVFATPTTTTVATSPTATATVPEVEKLPPRLVDQDPVDDYLERRTGQIKRSASPLCKHGALGMCDYCMPLEPYDAKYLEENKIKHMSFHAYLRKTITQNKTPPPGSHHFIPPLDELDLSVKIPCPSKTHEPYPAGICTKCQPSALSLQSQSFRLVDHIEFETPSLIENLLQFWRSTGYQRFGYLYGRFEPYTEVPLGVKAVVSAIYEPDQAGAKDGIQINMEDPQNASVDELAKLLGLTRVGIIFTDLTDDGTSTGKVICKRHSESYFLSSAECIFAAQQQSQHPVKSRYSETGNFGSRFVTCVVSGNEEGNIDISSFQVSNTCMAMVNADIIEASVNPSLMRVKESTLKHYVPEVFFKYKNEYGIMVQEAAKPTFPIEYLLVTVTHGFPANPSPTFISSPSFPIANRQAIGISQTMGALKSHLNSNSSLSTALADFHALLYLKESHILEKDDMDLAAEVARTKTPESAIALTFRGSWRTLITILGEGSDPMQTDEVPRQGGSNSAGGGRGNSSGSSSASWACEHCTYVNVGTASSCEMCGLPKDGR
ncbi:NPL4 family-domain-containing protein [Cladochytrium replicatum]|nr:NPL4 family-domain-containing protein [Cladochytrium replicatum]